MSILRLGIDLDLIEGRFCHAADFMRVFANAYQSGQGDIRKLEGEKGRPLILEMNGTVMATGEECVGARITVVHEPFDRTSRVINPAQTVDLDEQGRVIGVTEHERTS